MKTYEYKAGDLVEIINDSAVPSNVGRTGRIIRTETWHMEATLVVQFDGDDQEWDYLADNLQLTDPVDTAYDPESMEDLAQPQRVSDADKLRLLDAVVDAQPGFGTDLADFKRRLQIVLGL